MDLNEIRANAQCGVGPCEGCPAHDASGGRLVNPGLGNPDADVVFVTEEPRHLTDWSKYDSWAEYNDEWLPRFARARGGRMVNRLLSETDLRLEDVWIADSIKCPTKADSRREIPAADTKEAFHHCGAYLKSEVSSEGLQAVVTLGKRATIRTLMALGVSSSQARGVLVTRDYGMADFETATPVIISLHWAQRTVPEDEWVPTIKRALVESLNQR